MAKPPEHSTPRMRCVGPSFAGGGRVAGNRAERRFDRGLPRCCAGRASLKPGSSLAWQLGRRQQVWVSSPKMPRPVRLDAPGPDACTAPGRSLRHVAAGLPGTLAANRYPPGARRAAQEMHVITPAVRRCERMRQRRYRDTLPDQTLHSGRAPWTSLTLDCFGRVGARCDY